MLSDIMNQKKWDYLEYADVPFFIANDYWYKYADIKLNNDQLNEVVHEIQGNVMLATPKSAKPKVTIDYSSFNRETSVDQWSLKGYHVNKNTLESFEQDAEQCLDLIVDRLRKSLKSEDVEINPVLLTPFVLCTYADLKKYVFRYSYAYPTFDGDYFCHYANPVSGDKAFSFEQVTQIQQIHQKLHQNQRCMYFITVQEHEIFQISLDQFGKEYEMNNNCIYVCYAEPVYTETTPSIFLRNVLFLLLFRLKLEASRPLKILSMRKGEKGLPFYTILFTVSRVADQIPEILTVTGWKNNKQNVRAIFKCDLESSMDPLRMAENLSMLNLKLMKWNLEPDLNLQAIEKMKCLLLGMGTLGCSVSRTLVAWGVKRITFVDNGQVQHSNPIRQSLYTYEDAKNKMDKVIAAANALTRICPFVDPNPVKTVIPMLGHGPLDIINAECIERLIQMHDVIFLLTDSRESRWLATVLGSFYMKIVITVALGYDSFLVMRHGIPYEGEDHSKKLGCYFCGDITTPGNSLASRTLDKQCSVSRCGLSDIASSHAVELLVSLLQHPQKARAKSEESSCLGRLPHSIRGFLAEFKLMFPSNEGYDKCIACSPIILNEYRMHGMQFVEEAFESPTYLEELTGLCKLKEDAACKDMIELSDDED